MATVSQDIDEVSIDAAGAARERLAAAARRLYDAEVAVHIAHQTRVDHWIAAANDRLHEAVVEHRAAEQACRTV